VDQDLGQAGRPDLIRGLLQEELHGVTAGPGLGVQGPGLEEGVEGGRIKRIVAEFVGLAVPIRLGPPQADPFPARGHEGEGLDPLAAHELVEVQESAVMAAGIVEESLLSGPLGGPLAQDDLEARPLRDVLQAALGIGQEFLEQFQRVASGWNSILAHRSPPAGDPQPS